MAKRPVPRMVDENLPTHTCNECWYYEPMEIDHGACFGVPPTCVIDKDGDVIYPRVIVLSEDRGCHFWKPRHTA